MTIKTERVKVSEIDVGDSILYWDRAVVVEEIERRINGRVFTASDGTDDGYSQFLRFDYESVTRLTSSDDDLSNRG